MKNIALALVIAFSFATFTMTGCGGSGESSVVEKDPNANDGGLSQQDAASYEDAMNQQAGQAKPGN